jgi:hypothetical protein
MNVLVCRFLAVLTFWTVAQSAVFADGVELSAIARLPDGRVQITLQGSSPGPVVLQASSDFKSWSDLQSFNLNGTPVVWTDANAASLGERIYRAKTGGSPPATLPDLGELENRVFPAPEGINTIQYAPNGKLGFIAWRDQQLIFRERDTHGSWSETVVDGEGNTFKPYLVFDFTAPREDYRFQPSAVLLYDSNSRAHVFQASGTAIEHYTGNSDSFTLAERIADPQANDNIAVLEGVIGPDNVLHFVALSAGSPRNLTYGSNQNGTWSWTTISTVTDPPLTYWAPPFAARWLSMAVDSNNHAHIAYRTGLELTYDPAGHPLAHSELRYASNVSGQWSNALVQGTQDSSGEAANGASIAIGADNRPAIVSWYDERADTGSAQESRMYWHQQDGSGQWQSTIIATAPDGYVAGDGPKGTGFSPYLRYDAQGRPHILFLDHAGEHFGGIGQQEYAGNLRHGWWNGSSWNFETIYRQTNPLQSEIVYPAFAMNGSELAVTFLQRDTAWNLSSFPPVSPSKYYFRVLTRPLP